MGQEQFRMTDSKSNRQEKEKPQEAMRSKASFKPAIPMATSPKATGDGKRSNPGRPV